MYAGRLFRCQDLLSPIPELRCRRAAALGRDFQRPTEMLARMLEPDAQPVKAADFIIERADMFELLGERRRLLGCPGFKPAPALARQPRLALAAAPDPDRLGARHLERVHSALVGRD